MMKLSAQASDAAKPNIILFLVDGMDKSLGDIMDYLEKNPQRLSEQR